MGVKRFLVFLLLAIPTVAFAAESWGGEWSYAGGDSEIGAMEEEVDAVVGEMNLFIRPMARARLKNKVCRPWTKVEIETNDGTITIRTDDGGLTSPLGKKVKRKGDSDELTVHRRMRGDVLVDTVSSERGGRTNEFRIAGDELNVRSKIFSPELPRPIHFSYTYRR
jgi:hypothetical protein